MPHFDKIRIQIAVTSNISLGGSLDSSALLLKRDTTVDIFDTIRENHDLVEWPPSIGFWTNIPHADPNKWSEYDDLMFKAHEAGHDTLSISGRGVNYVRPFKLLLYFKNRRLESPLLNPQHRECEFNLVVHGNTVIDKSPFFQISWSEYFSYLLSTILIELFVALIYFWRRRVPLLKAHSIITANLISHPLLWTASTYMIGFGWGEFTGEIAVVLFEAWWIHLFCNRFLTFKQSLNLSFLMNIVSYILGGLFLLFQ